MADPVKINARSELIHAEVVVIQDVSFWSRTDTPKIEPASDDFIYVVEEQDVLDNLAARFYGDPHLRWVIKRINQIWLEPNELIPGNELRIPSSSRLRSEGVILR